MILKFACSQECAALMFAGQPKVIDYKSLRLLIIRTYERAYVICICAVNSQHIYKYVCQCKRGLEIWHNTVITIIIP